MRALLLSLALCIPAAAADRAVAPAAQAPAPFRLQLDAPALETPRIEAAGLPEAPAVALPASAIAPTAEAAVSRDQSAQDLQAAAPPPAPQADAAQQKAASDRRFDGSGPQGPQPDLGKAPFFVRHYWTLRPLRPFVRLWLRPKISGREKVRKGAKVVGSRHVAFGPDVLGLSLALDEPLHYFFKRSLHDAQPIKARLRADDAARSLIQTLYASGDGSDRVRARSLEGKLLPRWKRGLMRLEAWAFPKVFDALGTIPVSSQDPPAVVEASLEAGRQALRRGESAAIFVDQELTRTGFIGGVRPGFARVANGVPGTPVYPVDLDGLWGHRTSRRHLPHDSYLLETLPRMRIRFGDALRENTPQEMRQAIESLNEQSMRERVAEERRPIAQEFLARAHRFWGEPAVVDAAGGHLTYGELAARVVGASRRLQARLAAKASEPAVAVMLPPSIEAAEANLMVAALGRVVVNVDYTADPGQMADALASARVGTILTTRAFAREQGLRSRRGQQVVFIEDLVSAVPGPELRHLARLIRWLPSSWSAKWLLPDAALSLNEEAAIVFTSGSDSKQKGVVLTHGNVLAGVEMAREILTAARRDTVLAVMPFFSAFGVARGLWLPLLSGMQAAYHRDFSDAAAIAALAETAKPTLLFATPTILRRYAREVPRAAFASLRFVVSSAEKLHKSVAEEFKAAFGARPIEEYGSTETSSLIAVSVPEPALPTDPNPDPVYTETAGRNVPGTVVKAVDPDTGRLVPEGQTGLLIVKGGNVMKGYLGEPERTAAVLQDGWYVTDDLGSIDREGRLTIAGPKARRSRVSGELVSHAAVEEKLRAATGEAAADFVVTGVSDVEGRERLVALYSGWDGDASALREKARALGLSEAALPAAADFHRVERIPRLGNSKLDLMAVNRAARRLSGLPE